MFRTVLVLCYVHLLFLLTSSSWSSVVGEGAKPAGRSSHTMVLEAERRFWLFGGSATSSLRFSDLWIFDLELQVWFQLEASQLNETPTAREDQVAVWDPGGSALWVHGGYDGANFLQDLWHYSAGTWTLQSQDGPTRSGHIAVWNEFSLLIHGGFDGTGLHSDTWKFDSHSLSWTQIFSVNEETGDPSPRAQHVGVWDALGILWIHGGFDGSSFCDDLWKFHLGTSLWTRIASTDVPARRGYHAAAWDDLGAALWIHGGIDAHVVRGDIWRFDTHNNLWSFMGDSTVEAPFGRYNHVAAWDLKSKTFWIHGGQSAQAALGALGDFWNSDVRTTVTSSFTSTVSVSTYTSTVTFTDTSTVTRTSTQSGTTSAWPGVTRINAGISPVSLSILVVALLGGLALLAFLLGGRCGGVACGKITPNSVVMPMKQQNEAILGPEPAVSSPLPSPAIPWCMEVNDLPDLIRFEEWLLRIPMDDDVDCDDHDEDPFHLGPCCSERSLGSEETRQHLPLSSLFGSKQPSVSQVLKDEASAPTGSSGSSTWKVRKDLNAVGFVDQLPSVPPSPDHAAFSSPAPVMGDIHPADGSVKCLLPVTECPSIDLPGLNLPGPFQISELVPIHWPHLVSQLSPSFSPAPLSLPTPRCCGDHGNIMPRRPTVPLAVQLSEILLEPATNPVPPKRSKTTKKAWKRPKSTTLGGPYWTAQSRPRSAFSSARKGPGPTCYDPQHPNIHGWIPGHGLGGNSE